MPRAPTQLDPIVLTFGAGINSRTRPFDLVVDECVSGENFALDPAQRALKRRDPFELLATAPNAQAIRGFAQLIKRDGTISTLVQAGTNVYEWNGESTFTLRGTVSATAKLRGPPQHNFTLDDVVIITDLSLTENVKQWNGTAFSDFTHNLGGSLKAKFCRVRNERLFLANVVTSSTTPHVLIGSALGDDNTLTVTNRPSSSISFSDPFFIPTPDLKPINGLVEAFGQFLISTRHGHIHNLAGSSAFDFELRSFYEGSAASGDEAMIEIGNDVLIGQSERIESLSGIVSFGDVETNDISLHIGPSISGVLDWKFAYDRGNQVVYCFPDTQAVCWVLFKALLNPISSVQRGGPNPISPWSKWTTSHTMSMQPTCVMGLKDPVDGDDIVLFGDGLGRIYEFGGDGDQDGGTDDVTVIRRSKVFNIPAASIYDLIINVDYRRQFATDITLRFYFGGIESADALDISFTLSADDNLAVYNGAYYYSGGSYYTSTINTKLRRQQKHIEGRGEFVQVEVQATSSGVLDIQQIELLLTASET